MMMMIRRRRRRRIKVTVDKFQTVPVSCSKKGHSINSKKCTVTGCNDTQTW